MLEIYDEFQVSQHFAVAIEYGDYSGLSDDDIQQLDIFMESMPDGYKTFSYSDNTRFYKDEISGLMADCIDLTVLMDSKDIR